MTTSVTQSMSNYDQLRSHDVINNFAAQLVAQGLGEGSLGELAYEMLDRDPKPY